MQMAMVHLHQSFSSPSSFGSMCSASKWKIWRLVGNIVGTFVDGDPELSGIVCTEFMRLRARIELSKPLRRSIKLQLPSGRSGDFHLRYERVTKICAICGAMSHVEADCIIRKKIFGPLPKPLFGLFLSAVPLMPERKPRPQRRDIPKPARVSFPVKKPVAATVEPNRGGHAKNRGGPFAAEEVPITGSARKRSVSAAGIEDPRRLVSPTVNTKNPQGLETMRKRFVRVKRQKQSVGGGSSSDGDVSVQAGLAPDTRNQSDSLGSKLTDGTNELTEKVRDLGKHDAFTGIKEKSVSLGMTSAARTHVGEVTNPHIFQMEVGSNVTDLVEEPKSDSGGVKWKTLARGKGNRDSGPATTLFSPSPNLVPVKTVHSAARKLFHEWDEVQSPSAGDLGDIDVDAILCDADYDALHRDSLEDDSVMGSGSRTHHEKC